MMTAAGQETSVIEGVRSLEVRWIFPGQLAAAVDGWLARFPAGMESREDIYLLNPHLPGLSVKVRGGAALEVKVYRGSPGILEVAGRARGRLESWQKWSFPCGPPSPDSAPSQGGAPSPDSAASPDSAPSQGGGPPGRTPVRKRRRISRFPLAGGPAQAHVPGHVPAPGAEPACEVELTEIHTRGQDWWSLGFEATGPASLLRGELEATAALVFARALPGGVEPGTDGSRSYEEWLRRWPGPDGGAGT